MTLLRSRKPSDEVHLDLVRLPFRNCKWLQSSSRLLMFGFDARANVTFRNILGNVRLHTRPPEPLTNVVVHLGTTRVNRKGRIASLFQDVRDHGPVALVYWNH